MYRLCQIFPDPYHCAKFKLKKALKHFSSVPNIQQPLFIQFLGLLFFPSQWIPKTERISALLVQIMTFIYLWQSENKLNICRSLVHSHLSLWGQRVFNIWEALECTRLEWAGQNLTHTQPDLDRTSSKVVCRLSTQCKLDLLEAVDKTEKKLVWERGMKEWGESERKKKLSAFYFQYGLDRNNLGKGAKTDASS